MKDKNQQKNMNEMESCNHNYNDKDNTLIGVAKIKMVSPATYYLRCTVCGEIISVNKNDIVDIKEFFSAFF